MTPCYSKSYVNEKLWLDDSVKKFYIVSAYKLNIYFIDLNIFFITIKLVNFDFSPLKNYFFCLDIIIFKNFNFSPNFFLKNFDPNISKKFDFSSYLNMERVT